MKKACYYHIYLSDDIGMWSSIFLEQIKCMEDSGLLSELDYMKINCVGQNDGRAEVFASLLKTSALNEKRIDLQFFQNTWKNDHEMINNLDNKPAVTENITIRQLWADSQNDDMKILYFHAKAVTSTFRVLLNQRNPQLYRQNYNGRQFLNWGFLTNWKTCVDALDTHDAAGVNYQKQYPCFGGNYWWTKSPYVRTLADPSTNDWWYKRKQESDLPWLKYEASERFKDEQWILSNKDARVYDMLPLKFPEEDPFLTYFPASKYVNREKAPIS